MSQKDSKELAVPTKAIQLEIIELDDIALDLVTGGRKMDDIFEDTNVNCGSGCPTTNGGSCFEQSF